MDPEQFKTDWLPKFLSHFKEELNSEQKEETICSLIHILESKEKYLLQSSLPDLLYRDFIQLLPYELLERIIGFLEFEDILNCCKVSKLWNEKLTNFSRIWKTQASNCLGLKTNLEDSEIGKWKDYAMFGRKWRHRLKNGTCFSHHSLSKLLTSVGTSFSAGNFLIKLYSYLCFCK